MDIEVYHTFSTIYYVHLFAVCQTINKILLVLLLSFASQPDPPWWSADARVFHLLMAQGSMNVKHNHM